MKEHERIFFALCYNLRNLFTPCSIINLLSNTIPYKRCWYYLEKWDKKGFYDYGVALDHGWIYPDKLPPAYAEIVSNIPIVYPYYLEGKLSFLVNEGGTIHGTDI